MRSTLIAASLAVGLLAGAPTIVGAQIEVSTRSASESILGLSGDALIGQSFIAPIGNPLLLRWNMAVAVSEPSGQLQAGLWTFNPDTRTRGTQLWQSARSEAPTWGFQPTLVVPFTSFEVNVRLQEGVQYIFGVTTQSSGNPDIRSLFSDVAYTNGGFYYWWAPNYTGLAEVGTVGLSSDLAFNAQFEPATEVTEPAEWALVAVGLCGTVMIGRLRRMAAAWIRSG